MSETGEGRGVLEFGLICTLRVAMIGCAGSIGVFAEGAGREQRLSAERREGAMDPNFSWNFTRSISIAAAVKGVTN